MKQHFLIVPALLILTIGARSLAQAVKPKTEHPPNGHNSPFSKDLKDLLADPAYYNGEPIRTFGYLILNPDTTAMYLSETDYKANRAKGSMWIHFSPKMLKAVEKFNKHFVSIEGIFDGTDHGKEGKYAGALKAVTKISISVQ